MELQQLRYFISVAESRKFTTAARHLHVAQPSVSKQVRKLETELGAILLERGRAGVALTDAGAIFLPWARRVLGGRGSRDARAGTARRRRDAEPQHGAPAARARGVPRGASRRHAHRHR